MEEIIYSATLASMEEIIHSACGITQDHLVVEKLLVIALLIVSFVCR